MTTIIAAAHGLAGAISIATSSSRRILRLVPDARRPSEDEAPAGGEMLSGYDPDDLRDLQDVPSAAECHRWRLYYIEDLIIPSGGMWPDKIVQTWSDDILARWAADLSRRCLATATTALVDVMQPGGSPSSMADPGEAKAWGWDGILDRKDATGRVLIWGLKSAQTVLTTDWILQMWATRGGWPQSRKMQAEARADLEKEIRMGGQYLS